MYSDVRGQFYLIPINHEHPDTSVSVSVPVQPPWCLHVKSVNYDLDTLHHAGHNVHTTLLDE